MGPQAIEHWRLVLSLDKGCQASPQGPPEVPLGTGLVPRSGPLPVLSAPGLRVGTAAGVGEAPQGDGVAVAWPPRSGGAWAGPWGCARPCIPYAPARARGGRGGGRSPQRSGQASPRGSQSEALPGAAPTMVGRGHGLATPARVAGPREPHLCLGPSLVLSGSGASAGPLLLPSGFPLRRAAPVLPASPAAGPSAVNPLLPGASDGSERSVGQVAQGTGWGWRLPTMPSGARGPVWL